jgi:NADPH-dependent ferric siderophore reductase
MTSDITPPRHQITRVRRETRRRLLTVTEVERITPQMQRIRFASPDLHDFESGAPDDHIKLFLPTSAEPDGTCMRDYTPRRFDPAAGTLTIDFALHQAGPATAWALDAKPGDQLEIGGPRGSNLVTDDFDWYLLIGDETALPAIGRRLEELRPGVAVTTLVVVDSLAECQTVRTEADWTPRWVTRAGQELDDGALIARALADHRPPSGDGYVWIAAEAQAARAIRTLVTETWDHPAGWLKSAGYWVRGEPGAHE